MIEKLTKEQEEKLVVYREKWLKIGLSCEPADHVKAERAAAAAYKQAGLEVPEFIWADSPLHAIKIVKERMKDVSMKEILSHSVYGQHDASWLGFYNYFLEVCDLKICEKLQPLMDLAENCGWWIPYDTLCVLQEKTVEVHMKDEKLHNEKGPAVAYRDGFGVYALNGIRMPKELVMTPAEKINPKVVLEIKNVEIRREIVRKIGIEQVVDKLGAEVVDKKEGYELLNINLGEDRYRPYLKMRNASNPEIWHIEGVHPDCKTVDEALAWRNGLNEGVEPVVLT